MSIVLTQVALACLSDSAAAEVAARDRHVKAARELKKAGVTVAMIGPMPTDKTVNADFDKELRSTIIGAITMGVSAHRKVLKFDTVNPTLTADAKRGKNTWTVAELLALTPAMLDTIDADDVLRTQRRAYKQMVEGTLLGRIMVYLDREWNPDKKKGVKGKKDAGTNADEPTDASTMHKALRYVRDVAATLGTLKNDKDKGLSSRDMETLRDKLTECAATLAQYC